MSHYFTQPEEIDYIWMSEGYDKEADSAKSETVLSNRNAVMREDKAARDQMTTPRRSNRGEVATSWAQS